MKFNENNFKLFLSAPTIKAILYVLCYTKCKKKECNVKNKDK